ncbi:TPC1 [Symbiodinium sp. CCMP2592]|nr:TPC1 [Symbiodinium sp. CCMP2592]
MANASTRDMSRSLMFHESTNGTNSTGADTSDDEETSMMSLENAKIEQAAAILHAAIEGLERPVPLHGQGPLCTLRWHKRLLPLLTLWAFLGMLIEFIVEPHWCRLAEHRCSEEVAGQYFLSQLPMLRRRSPAMIGTNCIYIAPFVIDIFLQHRAFGKKICHEDRMYVVYVCCVLLYCARPLVDLFAAGEAPPVLPFLRAGIFVVFFPRVGKQILIMAHSMIHVLELLALGFLLLVFFAWMALVVFPPDTEEGSAYFPAFFPGMWSLFVLLTTANFPDIMMPAVQRHRSAFIFFLLFMLIGMFFLVNVFTAVVMQAYQAQVESDSEHRKNLRQRKVKEAFAVLNSEGPLSVDDLQKVIVELSQYADTRNAQMVNALDIDTSKDGIISQQEFGSLIGALNTAMQTWVPPPYLEVLFPGLQDHPLWLKVKKYLGQVDRIGWFIDLVLVINLAVMLYQMWPVLTGTVSTNTGVAEKMELTAVTGWRQNVFTWIFIFEAAAKLIVLGVPTYFSIHTNQFDFVLTVIIAFTSFAIACPFIDYDDWNLVQVVACARLFRLFRLLNIFQPYYDLGRITFLLLPTALDIFMILALICYIFSAIGVSLFGGMISTDPGNPYHEAVAASSFGQAGYWASNFNDFGMGVMTLFELLVGNNWTIICDGFTAAAGVWARSFFVIFHILGVLVGLNLLVSFIIGGFVEEYETAANRLTKKAQNQEAEFLVDSL